MPNVAFYRAVSDTKVLEFPSGGNPKELEFNVDVDAGSFAIRNVVVWFMRDIQ